MKKSLSIFAFILLLIGFANGQTIRYVTPLGAGSKNGTSWGNAYDGTQLQTAINETGVTQVWVAKGTYYPTTTADRAISFNMQNGVAIYGGFNPGATNLSDRDWSGSSTILDGGIGTSGFEDNSYHVIYNTGLVNTAILDGFTIQGGHCTDIEAGNYGGGIYNSNSSPLFTYCTISSNYAYDGGGGMFNATSSNPVLNQCTISSNSSNVDGGGIYNLSSSPVMTICNIRLNHAANAGGGMSNQDGSSPVMNDCNIWGNTAGDGGGISNGGSSPELTNCTISGNTANTDGGGIINFEDSSPILTNCLISGNYATAGGGIFNYTSSSPILTNCTITGNSAFNGGGLYNKSTPTINNSIIWGNTATSLGTQLYVDEGTTTLNYSCYALGMGEVYITGGTFTPDANCITSDPGFVNSNTDFRIAGDSPCKDIGLNSYNTTTFDIRGQDRIQNTYIDMGAYEYNDGDPGEPEELLTRIYVKADASGDNNGTNWDNAFQSLQDALAAASSGAEIWVASGTYKPTKGTDRNISFKMKNGVAIYGGFAGTETDIVQRNWATNATTLSGDIGTTGDNNDNSYHVIYNFVVGSAAILDGFTIQGGFPDDGTPGGGIFNRLSSPTLTNNTITGNNEGGIYNYDNSSPAMSNCIISSNVNGSGIENELYSSPVLTNCTIKLNMGAVYGGGIYNYDQSSPVLGNCIISDNLSQSAGGGIANFTNSTPVLTNCLISGNHSNSGGGIYNSESSASFTNCTITSNYTTDGVGGGVYNHTSSPLFTNCLITGNSSADEAGGIYNTSSSPTLINCTISGNSAPFGGGIANYSSSPTIKNSIIWGNTATETGHQFYNVNGSTITLNYSCYKNGTNDIVNEGSSIFTAVDNCITTDPQFINPNNYYLIAEGSHCADAGNNLYNSETTDIRGTGFARKLLKTNASATGPIDMGAYEYKKGTDPFGPVSPGTTIFVKADATGLYNGTNWTDAYTSLQAALSVATTNCQIWVAAGTYYPTDKAGGLGDRYKTFQMKNDVAINGGFSGTETLLSERNCATNVTIISGDIGTPGVNSDNSFHVIYNTSLNNTAILDGFTIQAGMTDNTGSGADDYGGGVYNKSSSPIMANCIISQNSAPNGGGMYNSNSSPLITNCTISGNSSDYEGGGIYNSSSSPILTNCIITGNSTVYYGGGFFNESSAPTLINCTISGNTSNWHGGGIANNSSSPTINNSIIWSNTATTSGNQFYNMSGTTTLNYSCYSNGFDDVVNAGGAISPTNCISTNPLFVAPASADYRIFGNSPCKDHGNNGSYSATDVDIRGQLRIQNTTIDMGAYEWTSGVDPGEVITWTGTGVYPWNWNAADNWIPNTVPSAISVAIIPDVATDPVIIQDPGTPAVCYDLTIETGAVLTISAGKAITVYGTLTNSAGTDGLIIKSDATGTGSLITNSTPDAIVERYVNAWTDAAHGWHLLSSPMAESVIDPLFTSPSPENYDFYAWWEPTQVWVNFKNTTVAPVWNTANVLGPTNGAGNFIPGKGYLAAYQASASRRFYGILNSADITISGLTHISGTYGGWHLLGNPFPSALNMGLGNWALNNITQTAKIWKESIAAYIDISASGGGIIPEGNGFMVETSGTGSLIIPAAARVHNATSWYKSCDGLIKLVAHDPDNNTEQESIIKVSQSATEGFDSQYDSHFLAGYAPLLYSTVGSEQLSTNTLPAIDNSRIIPMEFVKNSGTNFSIELAENSINGVSTVYLTDKKTGTITDLSKTPTYNFTASESDDAGRFSLSFASTYGINPEISSGMQVYTYDKTLIVNQTAPQKGTIWVYSVNGQLLLSKSLESSTSQSISLQGFAPGVYAVTIHTNRGLFNQKVVLK